MHRSQRMPAILFLAAAIAFVTASRSFAATLMTQASPSQASPSGVSPPASAPADPAKADYEAAERLDSLGGWDVFLAQHPTGDYATMAREHRARAAARLAALPGSAAAPADGANANVKTTPAARSGLSTLGTVECAAKYQAAKMTGKLNGRKWGDFRAAECGPQPARAAVQEAPAANPAAPAATASGGVVFPSAIDPKYAKEVSGKGRMRTCADQFELNRANNANGGMKWIDKGGGYYAECSRHLKGA